MTTTSEDEPRLEERLTELEHAVERGTREGRRAGRDFMIFAVAALGIALVTLLAVVAKLDGPTTTVVRGPMGGRGSAATAGSVAPTPARRISVGLREFSINPSSSVGRAGRVSFAVRNDGTVKHEFVVIRTDRPAGALLKGARADETGNVGETGDLEPGASKTIALKLAAGHYALICNLPGHYVAGQHRDFTVR